MMTNAMIPQRSFVATPVDVRQFGYVNTMYYGLMSFSLLTLNLQFHRQCMEVESSAHGWSCPSCKNSNTKRRRY